MVILPDRPGSFLSPQTNQRPPSHVSLSDTITYSTPTTMKLLRLLLSLSLSLLWSGSALAQEDDVPGCTCPATDCVGDDDGLSGGALEVCSFAFSGSAPFENITDQSTPLCDTLEASAEFQQAVGEDAETYFFSSGGVSVGPYYKTLLLPVWMGNGTCASAIAEQSSCVEGSAFSKTTAAVEPGSCFQTGTSTPVGDDGTTETIKIAATCQSWYNEDITTGFDDSLVLFVQTGSTIEALDLCDKDLTGYSPVLTSSDWVEPQSGRRYMCYEFTSGALGQDFYVLTMSLGNAPCSGPEVLPPTPTPSAAARSMVGMMYVFMTAGFVTGSFFLL